jgi:hypothetical protein
MVTTFEMETIPRTLPTHKGTTPETTLEADTLPTTKATHPRALLPAHLYLPEMGIILGGVARNIGSNFIRHHIPKLIKLGESLGRYHILVYESDSGDDTKEGYEAALKGKITLPSSQSLP